MSFLRRARGGRKRRVALVTPPSSFPIKYVPHPYLPNQTVPVTVATPLMPLGPAYLAASLEKAGYEVKIVDLTFMDNSKFDPAFIGGAILNLKPDIIGLSTLTWTIPSTYKLANTIRIVDKKIPIVVGGPHVSALPRRTLEECPSINAAIIGEGEFILRDFLNIYFRKGFSDEMNKLQGLVYRKGNQIIGDPTPAYIQDLDTIPFPARHLYNVPKYIEVSNSFNAKNTPVASMITSRGCPHQCVFCTRSNNGLNYRARSPENVVSEMEKLGKMGFKEIQIVDDNFTHDRPRVYEICNLIKEKGLDFSFDLPNGMRVNHFTEELMSTMYDVGFYNINLGVESGDDEILKNIRKGTTVAQIKEAIRIAKKVGFKMTLFCVIGLPGSTVESVEKTFKLVQDSGYDFNFSVCTPYPGSPLWDDIKDNLGDISWERYDEGDVNDPLYLPSGMTIEELKDLVERANKLVANN